MRTYPEPALSTIARFTTTAMAVAGTPGIARMLISIVCASIWVYCFCDAPGRVSATR
ncbi:unannotated protein [freshwater metagenome]|uniref:Unannotated protein n=1 Tax=freshwater metagenome TaxID=449393 RepID=A0A6J7A7F8_9ZZZZ